MPAARISIRRTSSSPRSTSATRRSTSFPARRARASTSASTTCTRRDSLKAAGRGARAAAAASGGRFRIEWEPSNADVFAHPAGTVRRAREPTRSPRSPGASRSSRPRAAPPMRASSRDYCPVVEFGLVNAHHARDRRARGDGRPRRADRDLPEDFDRYFVVPSFRAPRSGEPGTAACVWPFSLIAGSRKSAPE